MKNRAPLQTALVWMIALLVVGLGAGLIAGGVALYVRGTAAVSAGTADAVFTRAQAADLLRGFMVPALLLAALLLLSAVLGRTDAPNAPGDPKPFARGAEPVGAYRGTGAKGVWLLLVVSAALIAAGILNGGLRDVLVKAINICTECIGLG